MKSGKTGADISSMQGDYPLANTLATRMLAKALDNVNNEKGWSQRTVAKMLGYRASVALSHMALGRVPIPVERTADFARLLKMDPGEFLIAVLEQRYPDLDIRHILANRLAKGAKPATGTTSYLASELEGIANLPLDELPTKIVNVLRDVVGDQNSPRRLISMSEVPIVETIRRRYPDGLTPEQKSKLLAAIDAL